MHIKFCNSLGYETEKPTSHKTPVAKLDANTETQQMIKLPAS